MKKRTLFLLALLSIVFVTALSATAYADYPAVYIDGIPEFGQRLSYTIPHDINPNNVTIDVSVTGYTGGYADCFVDCLSMVEGYFKGWPSEDDHVYHAAIAAINKAIYKYDYDSWKTITQAPGSIYVGVCNGIEGYIFENGTPDLEFVYKQIKEKNPVIVWNGAHWVVIYGYEGSSGSLDWTKFKIMSPHYPVGSESSGVYYQNLNDNSFIHSYCLVKYGYRTSGLSKDIIDDYPGGTITGTVRATPLIGNEPEGFSVSGTVKSKNNPDANVQVLMCIDGDINSGARSYRISSNKNTFGALFYETGLTGIHTLYFYGKDDSTNEYIYFAATTIDIPGEQPFIPGAPDAGEVSYTVSYNANGGTGAPDSQKKIASVDLTLSNTVPVRDGYLFLGWAASSTASTATYQPGGKYTTDADISLYAVWKKGGKCGANLTWTLDDEGTLTITGTGAMTDYDDYSCSPWSYSTSVKNIKIGSGVTSIGSAAFRGCYNLKSVTIFESVTSIGEWAFDDCRSLPNIEIPNSVTAIGECAFLGCDKLADQNGFVIVKNILFDYIGSASDIIIPDGIVKIGRYVFSYCRSLTNIKIPNSVTSIGAGTFNGCSSLTYIKIPDSVISIGDWAFYGCTGLTEIEMPNYITSIGEYTFANCSSLKHIKIPNRVASIGDYAFQDCSALISVGTGSSVTSIGGMAFNGCSSLTSIEIPNCVNLGDSAFGNCTSLKSVNMGNSMSSIGGGAFFNCSSLTDITIPRSVTSIGEGAFHNCSSLTSMEIPDSMITIERFAFENCSSLTKLTIGSYASKIDNHFDDLFIGCPISTLIITETATSIGDYAFYGFASLTSLEISDSVTSIGLDAFNGCSSLTDLVIPDSVTSIGLTAFNGCSSLTNVTTGSFIGFFLDMHGTLFSDSPVSTVTITEKATCIPDYAFHNCSALSSVTIPVSVTEIGQNAFYGCNNLKDVYYEGSQEQWLKIKIYGFNPPLINAAVHFAEPSFCGDNLTWTLSNDGALTISGTGDMYDYAAAPWSNAASTITSVTINEGVTGIGDHAFYGLNRVKTFSIPATVSRIGSSAFICQLVDEWNQTTGNFELTNPSSLTAIDVVDGNASFKSVDGVLFNKAGTELIQCPGARSGRYEIPSGVINIRDQAFYGCTNLTDAVIIPSSVTSIGEWAFYACSGLTSVTIPDNVTNIGKYAFYTCSGLTSVTISDSVTSIGDYTFRQCAGLTNVTIPDSVMSIGNGAFFGCTCLTSVTIPDSVTSIGDTAFFGCTGLTSVTIPDSVTNIGNGAFSECTGLTSVMIPNSVASIGPSAFAYCNNLTDVYYTGTENEWNSIAIGMNNNSLYNAVKHFEYVAATLTLPAALTKIEAEAFTGVTAEVIVVPATVTEIGSHAFANCPKLRKVIFLGDFDSISIAGDYLSGCGAVEIVKP